MCILTKWATENDGNVCGAESVKNASEQGIRDRSRLAAMTVNGNSRIIGYSFRSQMTSLSDTNGQVFTYAFDGDGNRISQSLNDCLHARYIYDGPNVVLELNGSNEVIHAVVNGPGIDQPVERIADVNGEPRLRQVYHTDGLGSVALMTDEAQAPVKTYAYDAFGRIRSETGALVMNRWTYTGREALGDSAGLYYYRWRVMDPSTGRFTSEDPPGFVDGSHMYRFVDNSPVNAVDPYGLFRIGCPGTTIPGTDIKAWTCIGYAEKISNYLNSRDTSCQCYKEGSDQGLMNHCLFGCLYSLAGCGLLAGGTELKKGGFQWGDLVDDYVGVFYSLKSRNYDDCFKHCSNRHCK